METQTKLYGLEKRQSLPPGAHSTPFPQLDVPLGLHCPAGFGSIGSRTFCSILLGSEPEQSLDFQSHPAETSRAERSECQAGLTLAPFYLVLWCRGWAVEWGAAQSWDFSTLSPREASVLDAEG